MTNSKLAWDFFIAYSGTNQKSAEELLELLKPHKAFVASKCLIPGDDWDHALLKAQKESLMTVVLVSSTTRRSYYQREEIIAATNMARNSTTRHRVIPVFLSANVRQKQIPYGLQIKHGVTVDSELGLSGIAEVLKSTLAKIKRKRALPRKTLIKKAKQTLNEAVSELGMESLTDEVLSPLLQVLHPGSIEHISFSSEYGRALLSSGHDFLKRSHMLGVQPVPTDSLHDSDRFRVLAKQADGWKSLELARAGGAKCLLDELWIVCTHERPTNDDVSRQIRLFASKGIKFIWGDELCSLLTTNIPNVAARLAKYSTPEIIGLIAALSKHTEGRAFGFSTDRSIVDFYVTAALSTHAGNAQTAIQGDISIDNERKRIHMPLRKLLALDEVCESDGAIQQLIEKRVRDDLSKHSLADLGIEIDVSINEQPSKIRETYIRSSLFRPTDFIDVTGFLIEPPLTSERVSKDIFSRLSLELQKSIRHDSSDPKALGILSDELNQILRGPSIFSNERFGRVTSGPDTHRMLQQECTGDKLLLLNRRLLEEAFEKEIAQNEYAKNTVLKIDVTFFLQPAFRTLVREAREAMKSFPPILTADVTAVREAWEALAIIDKFIRTVSRELKFRSAISLKEQEHLTQNPMRIKIPQPEHLVALSKMVLVEGGPGCGKTTLLKMLAIKLLMKEGSVFYLPCSAVRRQFRNSSLVEIAEKFGISASKRRSKKNSTLIVDGLDEAAFDLSGHISAGVTDFGNIVISARSTFQTSLRDTSLVLALSPFDDKERDEFFEKWLTDNPELLQQARELIGKYSDIETHTRIPLIATITVALLQNGFIPKTRAEIYAYRLDLLLSKWDRFRGVDRLYVDNPDAKRRFLRELAFQMHSSEDRRRTVDLEELRDVYEQSLGEWGYNISYEKVLQDLIAGSGILIEERIGVYSFGHLTFQEHLAAEYIAENFSTHKVRHLLRSDWWREPLNFYASIKGNITDLIENIMSGLNSMIYLKELSEMVTYAPYTSPGAIECLHDSVRDLVASEHSDLRLLT
jgi:energy-coupling factor transporter ATP-binding protein EcfA2